MFKFTERMQVLFITWSWCQYPFYMFLWIVFLHFYIHHLNWWFFFTEFSFKLYKVCISNLNYPFFISFLFDTCTKDHLSNYKIDIDQYTYTNIHEIIDVSSRSDENNCSAHVMQIFMLKMFSTERDPINIFICIPETAWTR